ncbi:MAG: zinc ribbon domain-containing protein [Kineosporiaceae bacterium]|nr:zinc ribbon domain-containing protein [Kineosporiaceae bacterium]
MATFDYRCTATDCPGAGRFEVRLPVGTAPPATACPRCGTDAVRVFTPVRLASAPAAVMAALDRAERSRTEPEVVSSPPPALRPGTRGPASARPANPRWAALPRP